MLPSFVSPPVRYGCPSSLTTTWSIDSPDRSGMSRYAPWKEPKKSNWRLSRTSSDPSRATRTATSAFGRL